MDSPKNQNGASHNDGVFSGGLLGLEAVRRTLERDFFAEAKITVEPVDTLQKDLIVHLNCNFGLTESLFHLNNGNWGNFKQTAVGGEKVSPIQTVLVELETDNQMTIDIRELSIHLADTSIIISRLPNHSIADNIEKILKALSANFVHFTKGLMKMPYEIFVPIFEEDEISHVGQQNPGYLNLWGLYFEGEDESVVYDVNDQLIIEKSDFFLLNQWD